jgi:hypothetical protein
MLSLSLFLFRWMDWKIAFAPDFVKAYRLADPQKRKRENRKVS